jgi:hypothetical protein
MLLPMWPNALSLQNPVKSVELGLWLRGVPVICMEPRWFTHERLGHSPYPQRSPFASLCSLQLSHPFWSSLGEDMLQAGGGYTLDYPIHGAHHLPLVHTPKPHFSFLGHCLWLWGRLGLAVVGTEFAGGTASAAGARNRQPL